MRTDGPDLYLQPPRTEQKHRIRVADGDILHKMAISGYE